MGGYRRAWAWSAAVVAAFVVVAGASSPAVPANKQLTVRLGWQPLSGGSAIIARRMMREKIFEKEAAKLGYDLTVEWKTFAAGPPSNEAMVAGELDMDMHLAALPTVARIASRVRAVPVAVVGSNIANAIMVRPNSPIKDIPDLGGKTIGLPLGTSAQYVLASIIFAHFGKSTDEMGIKLVNMPVTDAIKMPQGIDAAAVWVPVRYIGPHLGIAELLVDGNGNTGKGYKNPGERVPGVKNAWAYPEGYNTDRLYGFAREKFLQEHPDVVVAYLLALQEAQHQVVADVDAAVKKAAEDWKQDEIIARTTAQTYAETSGIRKVPYLLEWDVLTLVKASEYLDFMKQRKALRFADMKDLLMKGAAVQKKAWELGGGKPTMAEMEKGFQGKTELYGQIIINGGAPVWRWSEMDNWGTRLYKKGPFPTSK